MFTILTTCILVASAGYVLSKLKLAPWPVRIAVVLESLVLPALLYKFMLDGLHSQMPTIPSVLLISIGKSAILLWLGVALSTLAPVVRGPSIPLALLWLSLGAWEYVWTLSEPFYPQVLDRLNEWLPATLVCTFFLWVVAESFRGEAQA